LRILEGNDKSIGNQEAFEYTLTYDGMMFNQTGGYKRQREITVKNESRKDFFDKMLLYGTWAIAIGALALVAWEIYKTYFLHRE